MNIENKKTILFVIADNDPVLSRVIRNKFEKEAGWQSVVTTTYKEALQIINDKKPSAVMTEIIIKDDSGRTGFDLIAEIKKPFPNIPIIVFSDLGQKEDKDKAMQAGASHYFSKNETSIVQLIQNIEGILEHY